MILPPKTSLQLKTLATAVNLVCPRGSWRPLEIFTRTPIREEQAVKGLSGRTLNLRTWRPNCHCKESASAIIIYAPFIEAGSDDPRLSNLASTFARAGFVVALPSRREDPFLIDSKDIDDVVSTVHFLRDRIRVHIHSYGLFGISSYTGPVTAAAVDPRIKDSIGFVISFAGCYDLKNVLRFVLTGEYSYKDTIGTTKPDSFAHEILTKQLDYHHADLESFLTRPEFEELRRILSPSSFIDRLTADFFIIHSTDDAMIPYTESLRLADALRPRVPVHLILISLFQHGTYRELSLRNIGRHYLPAVIAFYKSLYALLSKYL